MSTGLATHLIVLPGGGYSEHVPNEAEPVVDWLTGLGRRGSVVRWGPHSLGLAQGALDAAAWTTLAATWIGEQSDTRPIGTETAWN